MNIDLITTALISIVMFTFIVVYSIKYGGRIFRYFIHSKDNSLVFVFGEITKKINEREFQRGKEKYKVSIPVVTVTYKKKEYSIESMLYYPKVSIGEKVKIGVYEKDEKSGVELWIVNDMERARTDFLKKLILMISITILMILLSVIG